MRRCACLSLHAGVWGIDRFIKRMRVHAYIVYYPLCECQVICAHGFCSGVFLMLWVRVRRFCFPKGTCLCHYHLTAAPFTGLSSTFLHARIHTRKTAFGLSYKVPVTLEQASFHTAHTLLPCDCHELHNWPRGWWLYVLRKNTSFFLSMSSRALTQADLCVFVLWIDCNFN